MINNSIKIILGVFLVNIFISGSNIIYSQTLEERILKGIEHVYHLKFDSADIEFKEVVRMEPQNPAGYFFLTVVDWWKINIEKENEDLDEKFMEKVEKVIDVCDERLDKNENDDMALFYKGGALGYRGLVNSIRESWLKAAEDGREALNLLQKAHEINKNNKEVIFGVGLYNYFADYIPERYPVVKPLMLIFPKGDKLKGLAQIKETSVSAKYAKTEARFVLAYLYLIYENNYFETEIYSKPLHEEYPENPIFEKYLYNSYAGLGKWNESLAGWKTIAEKCDSGIFGYTGKFLKREANYYTALSYAKLNRLLESEKYINVAEELTKEIDKKNEHTFTAFIYLLQGMLNDVKGNKSTANLYYDKVLSMKNFQDSHAQAEKLKIEGFKQF
ncbi:MAG TPA: hypothetical protein PL089_01655 [Ignavibacteria bacterium]|nr:hypothetical protein [Ignavibacteria bacterium]